MDDGREDNRSSIAPPLIARADLAPNPPEKASPRPILGDGLAGFLTASGLTSRRTDHLERRGHTRCRVRRDRRHDGAMPREAVFP